MTSEKSLRVVGLGASMTAGTPGFYSPRERPPHGEGDEQSQYAYWLRRLRPAWEVLNRGMRGQRTDQILQRFEYDAVETKPDVLILMAGTNDLYQGLGLQAPLGNIKIMLEQTLASGRGAVSASIPPLNVASEELKKEILEFNRELKLMVERMNIVFFDAYSLLEDPSRPGFIANSPDNVHPGIEGYRKLGEALVPAVEASLERVRG